MLGVAVDPGWASWSTCPTGPRMTVLIIRSTFWGGSRYRCLPCGLGLSRGRCAGPNAAYRYRGYVMVRVGVVNLRLAHLSPRCGLWPARGYVMVRVGVVNLPVVQPVREALTVQLILCLRSVVRLV